MENIPVETMGTMFDITEDLLKNTADLLKEIGKLKTQLAKAQAQKTVIIEVGGDHGDGNVEVVKKPLGVGVIIKDFDNATLPEDADPQDAPEPKVREWDAQTEI